MLYKFKSFEFFKVKIIKSHFKKSEWMLTELSQTTIIKDN